MGCLHLSCGGFHGLLDGDLPGLFLGRKGIESCSVGVPFADAILVPVASLDLTVHGVAVSRVVGGPARGMVVVLDQGGSGVVVAGIGMALASSKGLDGQHQHAANQLGLGHVVEGVPVNRVSDLLADLRQDGFCEGRWAGAADNLVEVKFDVGDGPVLAFCDGVEPAQDIIDQAHHDGEAWLADKCPLAEGLRFLTQNGVVMQFRLIDLDSNDHVDVTLVVAIRDKAFHGLEGLHVNVRVNTPLDVHDQITQEICLDDLRSQGLVDVDDVGAIDAMGAKVGFDIEDVVLVGEHLVAVAWILGGPGTSGIQVALLEIEGVNLPCLPDLAGEEACCLGYLVVEVLLVELVQGGRNGEVQDDEDEGEESREGFSHDLFGQDRRTTRPLEVGDHIFHLLLAGGRQGDRQGCYLGRTLPQTTELKRMEGGIDKRSSERKRENTKGESRITRQRWLHRGRNKDKTHVEHRWKDGEDG